MKTLFRQFFPLFLFIGLALTSCAPEDNDPAPTDARDKFAGDWRCEENSAQNGKSTFTVHINKSSTASDQVIIENMYNFGFNKTVVATVSGTSMTIASQTFSGTNKISGSGSWVNDSKLTLSYTVDDGTAPDDCTATYTK